MAIQHKIAATWLNAAGVSAKGELLVWGSNKNFLLGKANPTLSALSPANLELAKMKDKVISDISMNDYHGACVANDRFTNRNPTARMTDL
jgi:hypothetical protein